MVKVAVFGMTRREEIYEASCECYNDYIDVVNVDAEDAQDAFIKGAEWADKTMIEKACEWAKKRFDLDYCSNVKDLLDYLKSLVEE